MLLGSAIKSSMLLTKALLFFFFFSQHGISGRKVCLCLCLCVSLDIVQLVFTLAGNEACQSES